jgi:hypothetical protein
MIYRKTKSRRSTARSVSAEFLHVLEDDGGGDDAPNPDDPGDGAKKSFKAAFDKDETDVKLFREWVDSALEISDYVSFPSKQPDADCPVYLIQLLQKQHKRLLVPTYDSKSYERGPLWNVQPLEIWHQHKVTLKTDFLEAVTMRDPTLFDFTLITGVDADGRRDIKVWTEVPCDLLGAIALTSPRDAYPPS